MCYTRITNNGHERSDAGMHPKIAIITAKQSFENISRLYSRLSERCTVELSAYNTFEEAAELYAHRAETFDGFLFSGWLPYAYVTHTYGAIPKPSGYFRISEGSFFRTMFRLAVEHPGIDYSRVLLDDPRLDTDVNALLPPGCACRVISFHPTEQAMQQGFAPENAIIPAELYQQLYHIALDTYRKAWREGGVDIIVTCLANLSPALEREGIPHYVLQPSESDMLDDMERLVNRVQSGNYADMLSVCGLLETKNEESAALLSQFARLNGAALMVADEEGLLRIVTSNRCFTGITSTAAGCRLSSYLKKKMRDDFHLGWGVGFDLLEARQNAQRALRIAHRAGARTTFLIDSGGKVSGPLTSTRRTAADPFDTGRTVDIPARYGVSPALIARINALIRARGSNVFTSAELAEGMRISQRSARRVLSRLTETGGALPVSMESDGNRGRPFVHYCVSLK